MFDDINTKSEDRARLSSYTSDTTDDETIEYYSPHSTRIRNIFTISSIGSLIFWIWAIVNTFKKGFDLGTVSFLCVLIASVLILSTPQNHQPSSAKTTFMTFSFSFVTVNYALGATLSLMNNHVGFGVYCTIFTFLWAAATVYTRLVVIDIPVDY